MPVVINEMEIEVEPAPQTRGAGGDSGDSARQGSQSVRPEEVLLVERVSRERMERVRAD
ncbi:MAG TPA: hypothetical protein VF736_10655 [Pyrinomonadaceae bacterium]|jgi:hypothetical protein